ncbi:hypothetical protein [Kutzneria albida]|uniref:Secreted protein n=1 Tax=Kutzneria albida DSM 43870 TaxID=1449976 RepID=W5VZ76_9PSEU|nr:hypothetical protein [Kutzneria albida]AHH94208.1 hypothetical protein KALB_834 [Kutzneria albida DSM 43870]
MGTGKRLGWLTTATALVLAVVMVIVMGKDDGTAQNAAAQTSATPTTTTTPGPITPLGQPAPAGPTPTLPAPTGQQPAWMRKLKPGEKPPQFVLFSFDGGVSAKHWEAITPIAKRTGARVTAMLSGVYLLSEDQANQYTGPGHKPGESAIGFGGSPADITARIKYLNDALDAGHEFGTHYNGHFCEGEGAPVGSWSTAGWNSEIDQFDRYLRALDARGLRITPEMIKGGRTPCLEGNWDQLFPAAHAHNYVYDTSHVSFGVTWPTVDRGMWEFPLPEVRIPALDRKVVMMDFNFWYVLDGAKEGDDARGPEFSPIVLDTYRSTYLAAYNGNRAPLVVANHFNEWAGGAFSTAVQDFMSETCTKPETVCATYSQVIQWMQLQDPAVLDAFRKLPAAHN